MSGVNEVPPQFRSCVADDGRQVMLAGQGLTSVPEWVRGLTELTTLDLNHNHITILPDWIDGFAHLATLDLADNRLTALPESIGNLAGLTTLTLNSNGLTTLPDSARNLARLAVLDLGGNKVVKLPDWIGELGRITWLSLYGNPITALPESIGDLCSLETLDLFAARLRDLPESIGRLAKLASLILRDNNVEALPESIGGLTSLTRLDLRGNRLVTLPRQLGDLVADGLLPQLADNPLADPLPEIIAGGVDALATYLRSLEDAVPQYEAKLLLVGEGNVGKTSLVGALRGAPFVKDRSTTHGIEVWELAFRHPDPGLELDMMVRAWDFGGQEVYRVSHQFFFSRRALYLVVWNAREGVQQNEVEDWLRRIRLRTDGDVRAVLVATHCAERQPELDYPHLKQVSRGMLTGSFNVDNLTGDGLAELRQAIAQQASALPQMGELISPRWIAARDAILEKAQSEPQISYDEFTKICAQHQVIGSEILTLAQLMHRLGRIIYFDEDEGLKDIVVLKPEWLTKAISYVLNDKATRAAAGELDHARLKEIWQDRPDGQGYPARYHPYFLRLMEKFDISYRTEGDERRSIVAQLVPAARPPLPWQSRTVPAHGVRVLSLLCRLSEPVTGLIPWLTVRHHRASIGRHWRHGVFLRYPIRAYASEALIELRNDIELAVEVRAPSPDMFFNVIRDSVEDLITHRWPGLSYELRIPCPGSRPDETPCVGSFPLNGLMLLREKGHAKLPCPECTNELEISVLLTGFATLDQPLDAALDQIQDKLASIQEGVNRAEYYAATAADSVRRVLRVVSTEVTDCPRLFTVVPDQSAKMRRLLFFQNHYRINLWCEHPGYWHPWAPATYQLDPPKDWLVTVSPYAKLIFKALQLVVPIAGDAMEALLPLDEYARAQGDVDLMKTLVEDLPAKRGKDVDAALRVASLAEDWPHPESEGLLALRSILFALDKAHVFGGLRRVLAPTGELLWVCSDHYPEYDPGLPHIP